MNKTILTWAWAKRDGLDRRDETARTGSTWTDGTDRADRRDTLGRWARTDGGQDVLDERDEVDRQD